jgi:hypothetical protein
MTERTHDDNDEPDLEEVEEDIVEHNPDPITQRESLEQELMEEGRSEEGEELELEEDVVEHRDSGGARHDRDR